MKDTILLIDGDVLAYRSAACIEKRSVLVTHNPTGKVKEFPTRTEFKERLNAKYGNLEKLSDYSIADLQTPEEAVNAFQIVKSVVNKLYGAFEPDSIEIYLGGKNNFRNNLPLPTRYKSNRDDMLRPIHLKAVQNYLVKHQGAKFTEGIEADDLVNIRAYEEKAKGNRAIICTNDKDTLQSEGIEMFDWTQDHAEVIMIPELGRVYQNRHKAVKGEGAKFFAYQLLCGDVTDCYKPTEVCGARFGPKGVVDLLTPLTTVSEVFEAVVNKYKLWYPDVVKYTAWDGTKVETDWQGMIDLYFKAAYMKRSMNDLSDWKTFFKERGCNV